MFQWKIFNSHVIGIIFLHLLSIKPKNYLKLNYKLRHPHSRFFKVDLPRDNKSLKKKSFLPCVHVSPSFKKIKKKQTRKRSSTDRIRREEFRNSSVFLAPLMSRVKRCDGRDRKWAPLSGRDNTCKYNPAGFHGAFNVSRACGMDIAHACPRVENFQKMRGREKDHRIGLEYAELLPGSITFFGGIIICNWFFATTKRKYGDVWPRRFARNIGCCIL